MKDKFKKTAIYVALLSITLMMSLFLVNAVMAADWFVRPSGESYGQGNGTTYGDAWSGFTQIVWATDGVKGGDNLYICGTHDSRLEIKTSGSEGSSITIRGDYNGDPGVIDHTSTHGIYFEQRKYLKFKGLTFRNSNSGLRGKDGCSNIEIYGCSFQNHKAKGLYLSSIDPSFYVEDILVDNCQFINIGVWGDTGANSIGYSGYARNTITQDCIFLGDGHSKGVDGILIENKVGDGSNHVIRRCKFTGHKENSIDLKHVVQSPIKEGWSQIYENDFSNSGEQEITIHHGTQEIEIRRNNFHDGISGIAVVRHDNTKIDSGKLLIAYNLFANLSNRLLGDGYSEGIGHSYFVNNTCYNIGENNTSSYSIQINTNNWVIKNNIFYHLSKGKTGHCSVDFLKSVNMLTIIRDNNDHIILGNSNFAYRLPDKSYQNVSQAEIHGLKLDPSFTSIGYDFSLKSISPCIDAGILVEAIHPTSSLGGNTVTEQNIDIGAYGFVKSLPSPPKNVMVTSD